MVSRDEAEPANLMPVRGAGTAGLVGRGLGVGSCWGSPAWALETAAAGVGFRAFGGALFGALAAGRDAAVRARGAWPRARAGFFDGRL